jgi:hypothetical protein
MKFATTAVPTTILAIIMVFGGTTAAPVGQVSAASTHNVLSGGLTTTTTTMVSSSDVHVMIEATCSSGVDFKKIPLSQNIYVGNVLQQTFNDVHDDERLVNVKFDPMGGGKAAFFGWTGDYNCLECVRDDTLHGKWETAFTSALETSEHKDLIKARRCVIKMKAPMMMTMMMNGPAEITTTIAQAASRDNDFVVVEEENVVTATARATATATTKCGLRACAEH